MVHFYKLEDTLTKTLRMLKNKNGLASYKNQRTHNGALRNFNFLVRLRKFMKKS